MDIVSIEEHLYRAWPALQTRHYDGWVLRFANGYTRRANSINPIYSSSLDIDEKIHFCESQYGVKTIFRLTPVTYPDDLDNILAEKGYQREGLVDVDLLELTNFTPDIKSSVIEYNTLDHEWFANYVSLNNIQPTHVTTLREMFGSIHAESRYFGIKQGDKFVSVGVGVRDEDFLGLFGIATATKHRKQGYAEALVNYMLNWGKSHQAQYAYLQVVSENLAANALYKKMGFKQAYQYWYRVKHRNLE